MASLPRTEVPPAAARPRLLRSLAERVCSAVRLAELVVACRSVTLASLLRQEGPRSSTRQEAEAGQELLAERRRSAATEARPICRIVGLAAAVAEAVLLLQERPEETEVRELAAAVAGPAPMPRRHWQERPVGMEETDESW